MQIELGHEYCGVPLLTNEVMPCLWFKVFLTSCFITYIVHSWCRAMSSLLQKPLLPFLFYPLSQSVADGFCFRSKIYMFKNKKKLFFKSTLNRKLVADILHLFYLNPLIHTKTIRGMTSCFVKLSPNKSLPMVTKVGKMIKIQLPLATPPLNFAL